ncbi:PepSY-associated TM helix domain-containing protein [Achromobacter anxifer]
MRRKGSGHRAWLVLAHRWVGLVIAGFLLVAGLTGALLAWNDELEALFSPDLFLVEPPEPDAPSLDPLILRERVQLAFPQALATHAPLALRPGRALVFQLDPLADAASGIGPELADDQVFVDPYRGRILGARKRGDLTQGQKNLMPFIYRLHYQLALGVVGDRVFGVISLLWTLDCFVGACLSLPVRVGRTGKSGQGGKSWLARWRTSWAVRWGAGSYKLNFDLHRAGGLWAWAMLFVLAWSAVAFNLSEVYDPVMRSVFAHQEDDAGVQPLPVPESVPALGWREAREVGRRLMEEQARVQGYTVLREDALRHDPQLGVYRYGVVSSRDVGDRWGATSLTFDAATGEFRGLWLPTGAASGDTLRTWLTSLHMAAVGGAVAGLPMKLLICAIGLAVAMLSVTGAVIWWKKRQARRRAAFPR